jgi:F420-non-reducing hydrogenase iron-sulfur subunit
VEVVNSFTAKVKEIGRLGEAEGIENRELGNALASVRRLIPYLRLVEREKLRPPVKTEEAYSGFFNSDGVQRLFDDLIGDNLAISRIVSLLRDKPLSTGEISTILGLNPSEVSKLMKSSSRQGFVKYDTESNRYGLAK